MEPGAYEMGKIEFDRMGFLSKSTKELQDRIIELENRIGANDYCEYKIIIKRVDNGFIMEFPSDDPDEPGSDYEVIKCNGDKKETIGYLLESVAEFFGIIYNKFKNDNLRISWDREGDHYEKPKKE